MSETDRFPTLYIPHGGGPWPFVELPFLDSDEVASLGGFLRALPEEIGRRPQALLVVSAHWEAPTPTLSTAERPRMLYDYYGFPKEAYELEWPAPGSPALAARVGALLEAGGIATATDEARGFDHGTFVPLKVMYPDADVPTVQLSLRQDLDPAFHLAVGRALAPLRDEGVLLFGSGMSFHDLRGFGSPRAEELSRPFDAWLRDAATADPGKRASRLVAWREAPGARLAHPREEHLLPLMVVAGAAEDDPGMVAFGGSFGGARITAFRFG